MSKKKPTITVLGAGLWGSVLANHLGEKGYDVTLWEFFPDAARSLQETRRHPALPDDFRMDPRVTVTPNLGDCVDGAMLVFALPAAHVRNTAKHLRDHLNGSKFPVIVSATKGVEPESMQTMCEVIEEELPKAKGGRVFAFAGPSGAKEVAAGVPTRILLAGPSNAHQRLAMKLLNGNPLVLETELDRKGVELCAAFKNVLAIGCGIVDGLRAGVNTKAALITQGLEEMGVVIDKLGGKRKTLYGLSGIGDLVATGTSPASRNRTLGEKVGQGEDVRQVRKEVHTADGFESAHGAHNLAKKHKIKAPLLTVVYEILHNDKPPKAILPALGFK